MNAVLRASTHVVPKIQGAKTFVTRTIPRLGDGGHVHHVFEGKTFNAVPIGIAVGFTVFGGIGIIVGAATHQNIKHGFIKR